MDVEPGVEVEAGVGITGSVGSSPGELAHRMTFAEKVTLALITLFGGVLTTAIGVALSNKRKAGYAEDTVYSVSVSTIKRLQAELETKNAELRTVTSSRDDYQRASIVMQANLEIAQQAAKLAEQAARNNLDELTNLRIRAEKADRYIFILRGALAQNNLPIPPEPN